MARATVNITVRVWHKQWRLGPLWCALAFLRIGSTYAARWWYDWLGWRRG